jgi:glycosyltransferase involved in cell wall biosynthesis
MSPPPASVLLPVYNAERYLRPAVDSVLAQTFTDFEVILLDDGSTDGSLRILEEYAARDARCRVVSRENKGLIATLNEGLQLARGEIIFRMDADDVCRPQRFALQLEFLARHPGCVAVGGRVQLVDEEGLPIMEMIDCYRHAAIDAALLSGRPAIAHPSVAMRATVARAVKGYDKAYPHAEDHDFFLKLAELGELANLEEVVLEYRQHHQSVGYTQAVVQANSIIRAVAAAGERRRLGLSVPQLLHTRVTLNAKWQSHQKWGWWALSGGNVATARKHAFLALRGKPLNAGNWRLVACAIRGH